MREIAESPACGAILADQVRSCSFLRFAFRVLVQFLHLTPKRPLRLQPPADRPILAPVLGSDVLCILLHTCLSTPTASEATRGYLHGGLALDLIGQKAPASKAQLVLLDLLVVALKTVQLATVIVRSRLRSRPAAPHSGAGRDPVVPSSTQDMNSEERGVRRSQEEDGVELQSLDFDGERNQTTSEMQGSSTDEGRAALLASTEPHKDAKIADAFNSGQIALADLDPWLTVKDQLRSTLHPPRATEAERARQWTLRSATAGRVIRMQFGGSSIQPS